MNNKKEETLKEFRDKFPIGSDNLEEQTHQSYPCYLTEFQRECVEDFLRDNKII